MFSKSIATAAVLVFATQATAQAGPRDPIPPRTIERSWNQLRGSRIRLLDGPGGSSGPELIGVLLGTRSDTLMLRVDGSPESVAFVPTHSTQIEEWHIDNPTKHYVVTGALLGSVVGGVVASVVNDAPEPVRCPDDLESAIAVIGCGLGAGLASAMDESADQFVAVAAGVLVGAALGALGGQSLGRSRIKEGWRTVRPMDLRLQPSLRGGVQFSVSLTH